MSKIKLLIFAIAIQYGFSASKKTSNIVPNGLTLHPTYRALKGFKRKEGLVVSYVDLNNKDNKQKDMWNLYYSKPSLTNFSTFRVTQIMAEWENRSYGGEGSFTSAAIGVNRLIIGNTMKNYLRSLNADAKHAYKPYLEFRMGFKLLDQSMFGLPLAGQLSYTLSDDYRFKSNLPNGYHKIPLKGFKADVTFRF